MKNCGKVLAVRTCILSEGFRHVDATGPLVPVDPNLEVSPG
jgi:hypothetical protein